MQVRCKRWPHERRDIGRCKAVTGEGRRRERQTGHSVVGKVPWLVTFDLRLCQCEGEREGRGDCASNILQGGRRKGVTPTCQDRLALTS